MKHLCIDARMINNSGIGVYIRSYITAILRNGSFKVTLLGKRDSLAFFFGDFDNWEFVKFNYPIYSITEQIFLPFIVPKCDVFWSPHYNVPILPIRSTKHLVTIPDVYHLAFFNTLTLMQKIYAKMVMNIAVYKASKIITISNYSKKEIVYFTNTNPFKIDVIYLGIDNRLFRYVSDSSEKERVKQIYQLPEKYILFVGNVKPNKNLTGLVEAFSTIVSKIPDIKLVITGRQEGFITGDPLLFERISSNIILKDRIIFTGFVTDGDLPVVYSLAYLFAFPSIYEGFGFPPLEAMACGCPVVASSASSIPEICGDAAFYVDPNNAADMANGLFAVATDYDLRESLVRLGGEQHALYNWSASSSQFIEKINLLVDQTA